jgi:hypothetical protein
MRNILLAIVALVALMTAPAMAFTELPGGWPEHFWVNITAPTASSSVLTFDYDHSGTPNDGLPLMWTGSGNVLTVAQDATYTQVVVHVPQGYYVAEVPGFDPRRGGQVPAPFTDYLGGGTQIVATVFPVAEPETLVMFAAGTGLLLKRRR